MSESGENLRRSSRIIARVRENSDSEDCRTPVKKTPTRRRRHSTSSLDAEKISDRFHKPELERELETIEENVQKPTELFDEEDVSANRYCGFQTPSKKHAMAQKALLSRTASVPRTPDKLPSLKVILERTDVQSPKKTNVESLKKTNVESPKATNQRIKNGTPSRRRKFVSGLTTSESESVSEESEFVPSNDDHSSSEGSKISGNSDNEDSDEDEEKINRVRMKKMQTPATPSARRGKSKKSIAYSDFHLKTDEYFEAQSGKVLTSDRTLARLKNPRLNEEKLQELLGNQSHISRTHRQAMCKLVDNYKSLFPMWYHIMEEGYSLLLHGVGSKRNLINDFHSEIIADHPTLVVNGFFPSLTVKDILDSIITELLELESPTNPNDAFNLIEENLRKNPQDRLYLLINNIDGAVLRSHKAQDTLSRLAALSNVRLLASVDHINAPLIWDNVKRSRYNFYWWDATTLLPYEAETSYESSLLVQHSGALALSSLHNVFQSLTANTKAIYILLVKHQLENGKSHNYPGMAFKDLYRGAREGFLVSSDLALRAQLTEFIDHKLVRTKRSVDGAEYLVIPLDNALLQQFIDQQAES